MNCVECCLGNFVSETRNKSVYSLNRDLADGQTKLLASKLGAYCTSCIVPMAAVDDTYPQDLH